ncbi:hypothetical protein GCM10027614_61870 [Micromonospora vulcania]
MSCTTLLPGPVDCQFDYVTPEPGRLRPRAPAGRRVLQDDRMELPEGLDWVRASPSGRAWLDALPGWLTECAERWSLRLGTPFRYAFASLALPAELPDGTAAVLKLQYPDPESQHEADALAHWNDDGAIRLLGHDPRRRALLVERCRPGTRCTSCPSTGRWT